MQLTRRKVNGPLDLAGGSRRAVVRMTALAILAFSRLPAEAQNTAVTGVVKNASGEPVAGAFVKVRGADSGLTFLVVSQGQGRYSTPHLLPGTYTVQGVGGGHQSEAAGPVEVRSGQQSKMDVTLSAPRKTYPPEKKMTQADYAKFLPEGEGKRLMITRCAICHGLDRPVLKRAAREEWAKSVNRMTDFLRDRHDLRAAFSEQEKQTLLDYVAKNLGPDSPRVPSEEAPPDADRHLPRTLLQGAEAQYFAVEFDLPGRAPVNDIALDSRGTAWVAEGTGGVIGHFDPQSLTYTRMAPPPPGRFPRSLNTLLLDARDQIWFTDSPNAQLFHYNPATKEYRTFDIPVPEFFRPYQPKLSGAFGTMRFHPDGSLWGTGLTTSRIVKVDPSTGKITDYPVPRGSHPYGMAIGADRMIWYTAMYDNQIVRFDPGTGQFTPYKAPTPKSDLRRMGADKEGNIWAAEQGSGKLVKVDYRTGKVTEYAPPTKDSEPYIVDVDTKRALIWFNEREGDKIGRLDPRTNSFVEFALPSADTGTRRIWVDPGRPNRVWWDGTSGKIGYIEVIE